MDSGSLLFPEKTGVRFADPPFQKKMPFFSPRERCSRKGVFMGQSHVFEEPLPTSSSPLFSEKHITSFFFHPQQGVFFPSPPLLKVSRLIIPQGSEGFFPPFAIDGGSFFFLKPCSLRGWLFYFLPSPFPFEAIPSHIGSDFLPSPARKKIRAFPLEAGLERGPP